MRKVRFSSAALATPRNVTLGLRLPQTFLEKQNTDDFVSPNTLGEAAGHEISFGEEGFLPLLAEAAAGDCSGCQTSGEDTCGGPQ